MPSHRGSNTLPANRFIANRNFGLDRKFDSSWLVFICAFCLLTISGCSDLAVSQVNESIGNSTAAEANSAFVMAQPRPGAFKKSIDTTSGNMRLDLNRSLEFESPNQKLILRFELRPHGSLAQVPHFAISRTSGEGLGRVEILNSCLGLQFAQVDLRSDFTIESATDNRESDSFTLAVGRTSKVHASFREVRITLLSHSNLHYRLLTTFRVYDDAVAVRSEVIKKSAASAGLSLLKEELALSFAGCGRHRSCKNSEALLSQDARRRSANDFGTRLTALPLTFGSAYEAHYKTLAWSEIPTQQLWGLPALVRTSNATVMITEADLHDYANAYLVAQTASGMSSTSNKVLALTFPPNPQAAPGVLVEQSASMTHAFVTPWRVMWIGAAGETGLHVPLESNLLASLNQRPESADLSWIRPGKVLFQWWNGYTTPGEVFNPPADVLQFSTLKKHVDFCADHGIPYFSIDGYEFDRAWYGGLVVPFDPKTQDLLQAMPSIKLPQILAYAKSRGVKARIWFHGDGLTLENIESVFSNYERWGVDGVMVDFLGDDTQVGIIKGEAMLRSALRHHLVVGFHGVAKPTGLTRTYPNLLTQEAVMGQEYNKWDGPNSTPDHEVEIGIIRGAVGPMDTHQGSFRPVPMRRFKAHTLQPNSIGTLAHQLSTYIVYENEQSMLTDYFEAYEKHPSELAFISKVPVVWDETRVLQADLAQHILVIARRSGAIWYIGAMAGNHRRKVKIPFDFLSAGSHRATVFQDLPQSSQDGETIFKHDLIVTDQDSLVVPLADGGGAVLRVEANDNH